MPTHGEEQHSKIPQSHKCIYLETQTVQGLSLAQVPYLMYPVPVDLLILLSSLSATPPTQCKQTTENQIKQPK